MIMVKRIVEKKSGYSYSYELITFTVSSFIGLGYSLATFHYTDNQNKQFAAITYGLFLAILSWSIALLLPQIRTVPKVKELLQQIQLYQNELENLTNILSQDGTKMTKLRTHLATRSPFMKSVGNTVFDLYVKQIQATDFGFSLEGEHLSLKGYEKFWNSLVISQMKAGTSDSTRLIARITHANDISIWLEAETISNTILMHQENFINSGGIIIRILVGPYENIDVPEAHNYRKVKERMEAINIHVAYVCSMNVSYSYDFAWIDHPEGGVPGYVVKWYSGAGGQALDKCEILDEVDENIRDVWISLAHKVHMSTTTQRIPGVHPFGDIIPESRHLENYSRH
jgi:hypothetical protein